jgi:imidazoleglycerol phosphate dehydratase HisB
MKAFARSLRDATELDPRLAATDVPSTKGAIG